MDIIFVRELIIKSTGDNSSVAIGITRSTNNAVRVF